MIDRADGLYCWDCEGKRYFDAHGRMIELLPEFNVIEAKIAWMDRVGMDVSVISPAPPIYFYWLKPEAGAEIVRLANDGIAQMVAKYPDRLRGMAHLPMQDPEAAIAELERVAKEYRFKDEEVWINRIGDVVVLFPRKKAWDGLAKALDSFTEDFMADRNQPARPERRKSL